MIDYGNMDIEVARQVQANQRAADQVRSEAQKRIATSTHTALANAQAAYNEARINFGYAQQPPQLVDDMRERALRRIEWEEKLNDARAAYQAAEQALQRARKVFDAEERNALTAMLHEAEIDLSRCQKAVQGKIGGAWNAMQAAGMVEADPAIGRLIAAETAARDRVNVLTRAIRQLY